MSKLSTEVSAALRTAGLRPTPQRYAVLRFLARGPVHATAEEIFHAVNRHDPRTSRATVYNALRVLAQTGLVREVLSEGKSARFDANLHRHHHFICERCGAMEDIAWFDLPAAAGESALGGRAIRNYEIIFRGTCTACVVRLSETGEKS